MPGLYLLMIAVEPRFTISIESLDGYDMDRRKHVIGSDAGDSGGGVLSHMYRTC
jgi:hypothetical protein